MQLRYPTRLTGEQYVDVRAWRDAKLDRCPNHLEKYHRELRQEFLKMCEATALVSEAAE